MTETIAAPAPPLEVGQVLRFRGQDHTLVKIQPWVDQQTGEPTAPKCSFERGQGYLRASVDARDGGTKDGPYLKDDDGLPIPIDGIEYVPIVKGTITIKNGAGAEETKPALLEVTRSDLSGLKVLADELVWCQYDEYPRFVRKGMAAALRGLTNGLGDDDRELLEGFIADLAAAVINRAPDLDGFWVLPAQILPRINVPLALAWLRDGGEVEVHDG